MKKLLPLLLSLYLLSSILHPPVSAHTENPGGTNMTIDDYIEDHHGFLKGTYVTILGRSYDIGWLTLVLIIILLTAVVYWLLRSNAI